MILADKIALHRKNLGFSQEEFAYKMNVSRQAVSKWEQAQSTPDLDKIILMAAIFGVSTDYLLKDDMVDSEFVDASESVLRRVSMEEANAYLDTSESVSIPFGLAVALCIMAPIPVLLFSSLSEESSVLRALGPSLLIIMIAMAVFMFIMNGMKLSQYDYLEKEVFELEYGIQSMTTQKKKQYHARYISQLSSGIILCILSVIPLFFSDVIKHELYGVLSVVFFLVIVALGVFLIVSTQIRWSSYHKILQEGDYQKSNKSASKLLEPIAGVYWTLTTALYLFISFTQNNWHESWIIWPVAGVLFGAISIVVTSVSKFNE